MTTESWEQAALHLQVGDVLTSKKGILLGTRNPAVMQACERLEYLGNNHWRVLGEKRRRVDVREVKEAQNK